LLNRAKRLLPRVLKLGKMTGSNSTAQLSFFSSNKDAGSNNPDNLDLSLQAALLNDCNDPKEEMLLAVAWGEPLILQEQLEKGGQQAATSAGGEPSEGPNSEHVSHIKPMNLHPSSDCANLFLVVAGSARSPWRDDLPRARDCAPAARRARDAFAHRI